MSRKTKVAEIEIRLGLQLNQAERNREAQRVRAEEQERRMTAAQIKAVEAKDRSRQIELRDEYDRAAAQSLVCRNNASLWSGVAQDLTAMRGQIELLKEMSRFKDITRAVSMRVVDAVFSGGICGKSAKRLEKMSTKLRAIYDRARQSQADRNKANRRLRQETAAAQHALEQTAVTSLDDFMRKSREQALEQQHIANAAETSSRTNASALENKD